MTVAVILALILWACGLSVNLNFLLRGDREYIEKFSRKSKEREWEIYESKKTMRMSG